MHKKEIVRRSGSGTLVPWVPFREGWELKNVLSDVLEDVFGGNGHDWRLDLQGGRQWLPSADVQETDKEYLLSLELPGVGKDDFRIELQGRTLIVSGEKKSEKEEKGKNYLRHEQYYGAFKRSFLLPEDAAADGVKAGYKNGILKISVPRSEKAKPKSIPIDVD